MMKLPATPIFKSAALAGILALTGCVHVVKTPKKPLADYPDLPKCPMKVAINITDEMLKSKRDTHYMGDTWRLTIGKYMAENVPILAQHCFAQSKPIKNGPAGGEVFDAILTPKITHSTFSAGFAPMMSLKTEWELRTPDGRRIWIDTVSGVDNGSSFMYNPEPHLQNALERLLLKSQQALCSANAIQQFAVTLHPEYKPAARRTMLKPEIADLCADFRLSDKDAVFQSLHKLRDLKATDAVPEMTACFEHSNPDVIHEACHVMADMGDKSTIPLIQPLLNHTRKDIRREAEHAIKRLNER